MATGIVQDLYQTGVPYQVLAPDQPIYIQAANTAQTMWSVSVGRKALLKKLIVFNRTGTDGLLNIGVGIAGTSYLQIFPLLKVFNGLDNIFEEEDLPDYWFNGETSGNILMQCSVGGAIPLELQVFPEVVEVGF